MGKREFLKIGREFEKLIFFLHFLAGDISLNNLFKKMKLCRHLVKGLMEGTVSQIFLIGPSFYFIEFRKKMFKKCKKSYPFV